MTYENDLLTTYDFDLPSDLIAQTPVHPRDSSRLLVIDRKSGNWYHRKFSDLPEYLDSNDMIIANNTQVIKARLLGRRIRMENGNEVLGGKVEFVMLEELQPRVWEGLFHASAKYIPGLTFQVDTPDGVKLMGKIVRGSSESLSGTIVVEFNRDPIECGAGMLPLPHYIQRNPDSQDDSHYQTVYAKVKGSAAAPTAGLHFTPQVLNELRSRSVQWEEVTLHVGIGTFRPVKEQDIRKHVMHEERYEISEAVASKINQWKEDKRRIVAVGTTSVRTLESAWNGSIQSGIGRTSIFIRPGNFEFKVVDRLITNFHLPKSTLLMLVCAFAGRDLTLAAYQEAVKERYRFFSYGDAMLIM